MATVQGFQESVVSSSAHVDTSLQELSSFTVATSTMRRFRLGREKRESRLSTQYSMIHQSDWQIPNLPIAREKLRVRNIVETWSKCCTAANIHSEGGDKSKMWVISNSLPNPIGLMPIKRSQYRPKIPSSFRITLGRCTMPMGIRL